MRSLCFPSGGDGSAPVGPFEPAWLCDHEIQRKLRRVDTLRSEKVEIRV